MAENLNYDDENYVTLIHIFMPYLVKNLKVSDLVMDYSLHGVISKKAEEEIMMFHRQDQSTQAAEKFLDAMIESQDPLKWKHFRSALRDPKHAIVYDILKHGVTDELLNHEELRAVVELFKRDIIEKLDTEVMSDHLLEAELLSEEESDKIKNCCKNNGESAANFLLLSYISKSPKWYLKFMKILWDVDQRNLIKRIDPDMYEKLKAQDESNSPNRKENRGAKVSEGVGRSPTEDDKNDSEGSEDETYMGTVGVNNISFDSQGLTNDCCVCNPADHQSDDIKKSNIPADVWNNLDDGPIASRTRSKTKELKANFFDNPKIKVQLYRTLSMTQPKAPYTYQSPTVTQPKTSYYHHSFSMTLPGANYEHQPHSMNDGYYQFTDVTKVKLTNTKSPDALEQGTNYVARDRKKDSAKSTRQEDFQADRTKTLAEKNTEACGKKTLAEKDTEACGKKTLAEKNTGACASKAADYKSMETFKHARQPKQPNKDLRFSFGDHKIKPQKSTTTRKQNLPKCWCGRQFGSEERLKNHQMNDCTNEQYRSQIKSSPPKPDAVQSAVKPAPKKPDVPPNLRPFSSGTKLKSDEAFKAHQDNKCTENQHRPQRRSTSPKPDSVQSGAKSQSSMAELPHNLHPCSCGMKFKTEELLKAHRSTKCTENQHRPQRRSTSPKPDSVQSGAKSQSSMAELPRNLHPCSCGMKFKTEEALKIHQRNDCKDRHPNLRTRSRAECEGQGHSEITRDNSTGQDPRERNTGFGFQSDKTLSLLKKFDKSNS